MKTKAGYHRKKKYKEGNFLEKEKIWPVEEKKNEREKDKIFGKEKAKIFEDGNYLVGRGK